MNISKLKFGGIKSQLFCSSLALLGLIAPSPASALDTVFIINQSALIPTDTTWSCPFPRSYGGTDWDNFTPFSPWNAQAQFNFRAVPDYVRRPGTDKLYAGGPAVKAVTQALYALYGNLGRASTYPGGLTNDLKTAISNVNTTPVTWNMTALQNIVSRVQTATGITDGGWGSGAQIIQGFQNSHGFYLSCKAKTNSYFMGADSGLYQDNGFMPNIDVNAFNSRIFDGTMFIVQTNNLLWNASKNAWTYGADGMYLVKGSSSNENLGGYSMTLYDVQTDQTKVVWMTNQSIRNVWSTGGVSAPHTVTTFAQQGVTNLGLEVIIGYQGMDAIVNHF